MDDADNAQRISDAFLGVALLRQRKAAHGAKFSAFFCIDCGDDIPQARREAVLTERCVDCAAALETAGRVGA